MCYTSHQTFAVFKLIGVAMSYGIIRMVKFKRSAVSGMEIHDQRKKKSLSNPDINLDKTEENIYLVECPDYNAKITENIQRLDLQKSVRKDAVVMCQFIVTSDRAFFDDTPPKKCLTYFKDSLDFIKRRYGADNIISATVHMDEKTPHLHVNFTPIKDKKLSAKSIFTRKELTQLQTDFHQNVGKRYGLLRGENFEEKRKNLSVQEYKFQTKKEELKKGFEQIKNDLKIAPEDVEPVVKKSSFMGLKNEVETSQEIADRLTQKYINPLMFKEKSLIYKNNQLQSRYNFNEEIIRLLRKDVSRYSINYKQYEYLTKDLSFEQIRALKKQAKIFREKNLELKEIQDLETKKRFNKLIGKTLEKKAAATPAEEVKEKKREKDVSVQIRERAVPTEEVKKEAPEKKIPQPDAQREKSMGIGL